MVVEVVFVRADAGLLVRIDAEGDDEVLPDAVHLRDTTRKRPSCWRRIAGDERRVHGGWKQRLPCRQERRAARAAARIQVHLIHGFGIELPACWESRGAGVRMRRRAREARSGKSVCAERGGVAEQCEPLFVGGGRGDGPAWSRAVRRAFPRRAPCGCARARLPSARGEQRPCECVVGSARPGGPPIRRAEAARPQRLDAARGEVEREAPAVAPRASIAASTLRAPLRGRRPAELPRAPLVIGQRVLLRRVAQRVHGLGGAPLREPPRPRSGARARRQERARALRSAAGPPRSGRLFSKGAGEPRERPGERLRVARVARRAASAAISIAPSRSPLSQRKSRSRV